MKDNQPKAEDINTGDTKEVLQSNEGDASEPSPPSVDAAEKEVPKAVSVDKYKLFGIVGYVVPVLFFIPLLTEAKINKFARYHANQQLLLLLFWVLGQIVASMLTFIVIGVFLYPLILIIGVIFMVMGIMNVLNGEMKPLPVLGQFELIK